jgi:outer membrane receptor protein involved in Fe transport
MSARDPGNAPGPRDAGPVADGDGASVASIAGDRPTAVDRQTIDRAASGNAEIVVTGTHIRGTNPGAPLVQTISRADMERNGYATVADAVQALPANFGGSMTQQSSTQFADRSSTNNSFATGVDLRGFGPGSTLVLVNGRRVAGSGATGAFADVSMIPTGAVDRVEVLLDGASAIYGADAVGGVVNIILRKPYDGAETRLRFGSVTAGGKRDVQVDQTVGKTWSTGGIMLSYEFDREGALRSADRGFAASADSRPYGGTDHRFYFSTPGNILGFDPVTGSFGPTYAIPPNQDGTRLTPASFLAGVTNLNNFRTEFDLIPRETRHSAYATLNQDLGDRLHFSADARYSRRQYLDRTLGAATIFDVTNANPYFVSPDSTTDDLIAYGFDKELGPQKSKGYDEAIAATAGLDADLGKGWKLRSYAGWSQERQFVYAYNFENDAFLAEALGSVPDDPTTSFSTAVDGYFNPYGTGSSNAKAILDFIGQGFQDSHVTSRVLTGHIDADGTLFELPGGAMKLALGGDVRRESFDRHGEGFFATTTPQPFVSGRGSRVVEAGFVELHVPVVGPQNGVPLVHALDLSVAGRIEHYSDFGTTTDPKIGASWSPASGITLRTGYGTSFRAPNLTQLTSVSGGSVTQLSRADGSTIAAIVLSGGNPGLKPELAKSWTAGADIKPAMIPGLSVSGTWFRTAFSRRIASPAGDNISIALSDPTLASFVELVSPSTNAADLAKVTALLNDPDTVGGSSIPATSIGAIVDGRQVNTGRILTSGIDVSVHYRLTAGANTFDLGVNGTYVLKYSERVTPLSASVDELDRAAYPVAFKGRATAGWSRGPFSGQVGVNYVNRYHDLAGSRIRAWTTVDLELGYTAPATSGWAKGLEASISVQNLFDRAPPFYDSPVGAGYDAANASALMRFVALQLSKRW